MTTTTTTTTEGEPMNATYPQGRRVMSDGTAYGDGPLVGYVWLAEADPDCWPPAPAGWVFETVAGFRTSFRRESEQAAVDALLALDATPGEPGAATA